MSHRLFSLLAALATVAAPSLRADDEAFSRGFSEELGRQTARALVDAFLNGSRRMPGAPASLPPATTSAVYEGNVGRLPASFTLRWHGDDSVSGVYLYPTRDSGKGYALRGLNTRAGELFLEEFTRGELTARIYLFKRLTDSRIVWEGQMQNTDGRRFPVTLSRPR